MSKQRIQLSDHFTYSIVRHGDANAIAPFYRAGTLADAPEKETEYE